MQASWLQPAPKIEVVFIQGKSTKNKGLEYYFVFLVAKKVFNRFFICDDIPVMSATKDTI
jgi:hypothetical protein